MKNKKTKNLYCPHYKKVMSSKKGMPTGYDYNLIGATIWLCKKCEERLRKSISEQETVEKQLSIKFK